MSSTGNCYDNAITESFFATLKTELVYDTNYRTRNEARRDIFKYIEMIYNRKRIHSAIGGISPDQFEQHLCHPAISAGSRVPLSPAVVLPAPYIFFRNSA